MPASKMPNFLVIMTDQHCYHQLRCNGNTVVNTPNIDRLHDRGTNINGVYTAVPMCMPNRQAFMTMRMSTASGQHSNGVTLDLDANTFPELLRAAGYHTGLIGKVHLQNMTEIASFQQAKTPPEGKTPPPAELSNADKQASKYEEGPYKQESGAMWSNPDFAPSMPYYGFDEVIYASNHGEIAQYDHRRYLDQQYHEDEIVTGRANALHKISQNKHTYASALTLEQYPTHFVGERSKEWLRTHAQERGDDPFFLWCSFPDPHFPWTPPEQYYKMYDPADVILPDSFSQSSRTQTPLLEAVNAMALAGERQIRMPFMATEEEEARQIIATAYGMITYVDEMVGEIVDTLEQSGLSENTVIIFTSDHGDYMGQHGLFLKGPAHYQSLIKVPFIWCDPDPAYNRGSVDALVSYVDIGRTILDRADLWPYHGAQGRSMLPLLSGAADSHRDRALVETVVFSPQFELPIWAHVRTLVTDRYRMTVYNHMDQGELYDLDEDPEEMVNLWGAESHAAVQAELLLKLVQEMAELTDLSRLPSFLA